MTESDSMATPAAEAVREAVARVLASEHFASSPRLQRFLSYIVEKKLAGTPEDIKEYNLALSVFDREPSFDARTDTIVRVEARRLRQQLTSYYQSTGRLDAVVIELPRRGYVPEFRPLAAAVDAPLPPSIRQSTPRWYFFSSMGVVGALAVLGLVSWHGGWIPNARVPHIWELQNGRLRILDAQERLCWEKRIPKLSPQVTIFQGDNVLIEDIDGDGRKEVLINVVPDQPGEHAGSLLCFDSRGRQRWQFRYGANKKFGNRTFDHNYVGHFLRPVQVAGKPRLIAVANHFLWYPSQVAMLDPANGHLLGEYWHPGAIHHCLKYDADQDGHDEIIFAAINNPGEGLGHAAVGVLKLPLALAPPNPAALTGGGEFAYILLPQPDVNTALGVYPFIHLFSVDQQRRILVQLQTPENSAIVYYLSPDLHVREYRLSDNFRSLHARLTQQKLLDHPLSEAELATYGKVASFEAAPDGNSPEVARFWKY